ncbi:MAG TPA: acyl carrier protein [Methylocystis sp.]|nr:acyl carrier protein [Methylocystis sp.]
MSDEAVLDRLVEIIRTVLDEPAAQITLDSKASDVPGWDSMSHIAIVVAVESEFKIKFRTAEIERLRDVRDFVELIGSKQH